ncbi:hypothetical protein HanXRQr2_Chr14g0658931 [Helianthus annuus]|uniref:Uncharacterized protein n=1 Tax=Helianthus annuus TaxID=4232 RepID=A0A9K3ECK8_HELAN|nr:hypothetical protein HanXRQr2_Chr14g0658931 [Helianthus annuus]
MLSASVPVLRFTSLLFSCTLLLRLLMVASAIDKDERLWIREDDDN